MENFRTKDKLFEQLTMLMIMLFYFCAQINAKFVANDVRIETDFQMIRVSGIELHKCVRIRTTFSSDSCDSSVNDFEKIHCHNDSEISSTDVIVSLEKFDFRHHLAAYLCISYDDERNFTHLGNESKFSR